MRTIGRATLVAFLLTVMIPAGASAVITCGSPFPSPGGPDGFILISVVSTVLGAGFTDVTPGMTEGGVTINPGTCSVGSNTCVWGAQGIPGGPLPQSAEVAFTDADETKVCRITDADGLPVELIDFSVE